MRVFLRKLHPVGSSLSYNWTLVQVLSCKFWENLSVKVSYRTPVKDCFALLVNLKFTKNETQRECFHEVYLYFRSNSFLPISTFAMWMKWLIFGWNATLGWKVFLFVFWSVFSPNEGNCRPEKLRIRTLFTQ